MFMCMLVLEYFHENRLLLPQVLLALQLSEAGDVQEIYEPEAVPPELPLPLLVTLVLHLVVERLDEDLARANVQVEELVLLAPVHEAHEVRIDRRLLDGCFAAYSSSVVPLAITISTEAVPSRDLLVRTIL